MPIVKIELELTLLPHELEQLRERVAQLSRVDDRILVHISDKTEPIRGHFESILGYPAPSEYVLELRASSPSQIEIVCDILAEFGTPEQQCKRRAADVLSRVAREANTKAKFSISPIDAMDVLRGAVGNAGTMWHALIRKNLR